MARVGSNLAMGHPHGISQEMPWELRASRLPEWNVHQRHFPLSREHGHWMNIDEYRHLSIFPILSYPVLSFPILSYPIYLSICSIYLSYLILSYLIYLSISLIFTHFLLAASKFGALLTLERGYFLMTPRNGWSPNSLTPVDFRALNTWTKQP
jgi:hypothetical protein